MEEGDNELREFYIENEQSLWNPIEFKTSPTSFTIVRE